MRIILILALALIVFAIFRRMNRDVVLTVAPPRMWEQRPPLAFEEYYAHYSDSGFTKQVVQANLEQLSWLMKVPAAQLRPDVPLEDLNPGAMEKAMKFIVRLESAPVIGEALREKLAGLDLNIVTVDDYIRKIGHLGEHPQGANA